MICRMALIKRAAIFNPAFSLGQLAAVDRLPGIRLGIADSFFGHRSLVAGEQLGKADGHDRPFAIFLVPCGVIAQERKDFGIAVGRKVKTSVAGRAMGDDTLGIDDSQGVSQTLLEAAITQPRPVFSCFVNLLQSEEARKQIILVIDGPAA